MFGDLIIDMSIKENKVNALKTYLAKCKMLCSADVANEIETHINEFISLEELFSGCIYVSFPNLEWCLDDSGDITSKMLIWLAKYLEDGTIWLDGQLMFSIKDGKAYDVVTKHSSGKLLMLTRDCDVKKRKDRNFGIKVL